MITLASNAPSIVVWPYLHWNTTCDAWNKPKHGKSLYRQMGLRIWTSPWPFPVAVKLVVLPWYRGITAEIHLLHRVRETMTVSQYVWSYGQQLTVNLHKDWSEGRSSSWKWYLASQPCLLQPTEFCAHSWSVIPDKQTRKMTSSFTLVRIKEVALIWHTEPQKD